MANFKYRNGKIKLEHHILEGLGKYLADMAEWEEVESIIPGRISRHNKGRGSKGLFLKYKTLSGYKLLYKNGTSVQEVFVVCSDYEAFEERFKSYYKT